MSANPDAQERLQEHAGLYRGIFTCFAELARHDPPAAWRLLTDSAGPSDKDVAHIVTEGLMLGCLAEGVVLGSDSSWFLWLTWALSGPTGPENSNKLPRALRAKSSERARLWAAAMAFTRWRDVVRLNHEEP